jgi:hypothetical protein
MDEEALIAAVLRIRAVSAEPLSVAQVHAALVAEGADVEMGPVKKAASKATKRAAVAGAGAGAGAGGAGAPPAVQPEALSTQKPSNKELKAARAAAESLKVAESCMMKAQKRLQNRHLLNASGGEELDQAAVARAVSRAISGALDAGETVSRERFEADVATLQYILHAGAPVALADEQRKAATTQLEMLMAKNG